MRNDESIGELESQAKAKGWNLRAAVCDVSDETSCRKAVEFAHQWYGPIQVLVNNAGYGQMGLLELTNLNDARQQLEVNTLGPMRLIQLIAPDMREMKWGRIINVSSIVGRLPIPLGGWYAASKFALEALNDILRLELSPFGIRTISILPGPVKTDFVRNAQLSTMSGAKPALYQRAEEVYVEYRKRPRPFEVSAETVARIILRAVESRNPRPRYYVTVPARVSAFGRRFLTDRAVDRLLRTFYGINRLAREVKD